MISESFQNLTYFARLELYSNRFSGEVPGYLGSNPNLNILSGNLFSCPITVSDPDSDLYTCQYRNNSYYLFLLGFLAVLVISGALLYYGPEEIRDGVINTHWLVGSLFFTIFIFHAFSKLRSTK